MKRFGLVAAAALACLVLAPLARAQVSFDGKKTAFHTTPPGGVALPMAAAPVLTATLAKGKKGHVVTVDATVTSGLMAVGAPWEIAMGADLNGIPMDPATTFPDSIVQDCSAAGAAGADGCTAHGTFVIDLDAAEAAVPGCCKKAPLTVTLLASSGLGIPIGAPVDVSMVVRMEKKK